MQALTYVLQERQFLKQQMQKRQFHNYKHFDFCYAENEYKYYDTYLGGEKFPHRESKIYTKGDYHYHCRADGEFVWFQM